MKTAALAVLILSTGLTSAQTGYGSSSSSSLPVVDLGYALQQATNYNATGRYYNFTDIRYAAPPLGENRFRAPQPPTVNRTSVQQGGQGYTCPQADPAWLSIATQYIPKYLAGQTQFNESSFNTTASGGASSLVVPGTTEDCLFLDIVVPQDIFETAGRAAAAPVLVWIYGGGYTAGSKNSATSAGLISRSQSNMQEGVVFVALNYRLGAFGWLSGPTFQANGTANAGLHDQRFALDWIQENIYKFGGDRNRVTIFGESAGGGSVMHQITAYGGLQGPVPFQQAIPQSPGFQPFVSNQQQEQVFNQYLSLLNVSTIGEARGMSSSDLIQANALQVAESTYGGFTYGPTVDGDFVPQLPGLLLLHGQYDQNVRVMVGHNADEGLLFTSPFVSNNSAFDVSIIQKFPTLGAWPAVLDYIVNDLYPPTFDGSQAQGYRDQIGRASALTAEIIFTCNTFYLDKAYDNQTYSYLFAVPPALHGQDIAFTFYPGSAAFDGPIVPSVALALQQYITDFAIYGRPSGPGVPFFNMYGSNATVQVLNITGIHEMMDPAANYRCDWWQKALYV